MAIIIVLFNCDVLILFLELLDLQIGRYIFFYQKMLCVSIIKIRKAQISHILKVSICRLNLKMTILML